MFRNINYPANLEESRRRKNVFIYKSLVGENNQQKKVFKRVGTKVNKSRSRNALVQESNTLFC